MLGGARCKKLVEGLRTGADRRVHMWTAFATAVAAIISLVLFEGLREDASTWFSTLTGFATLYGLAFAILEVFRLSSVTDIANSAALAAVARAQAIVKASNIGECQLLIDNVFADIDRTGIAPTPLLNRIVKFYASEFPAEMEIPDGKHRDNFAHVKSYIVALKVGNRPSTGKLRGALCEMAVHLVAKQNKNAKEINQ